MTVHLGLASQSLVGAATTWVALLLILRSLSGIPMAEVEKLELLFGGEKTCVCGVVDSLAVDADRKSVV